MLTMEREVRLLFRKEWHQLLRSHAVLVSAALPPVVLLVVIPCLQLLFSHFPPAALHAERLAAIDLVMLQMLPALVSTAGLIIPSVTLVNGLTAEREARTLDLLLSLPVSGRQVLTAKLLANVALALALTIPLLLVDAFVLSGLGAVSLWLFALMAPMLAGAVALGASLATVVGLLAWDLRAANTVSGLLFVPSLLVVMGTCLVTPNAYVAALALAVLYVIGAALALFVAARVITLERLVVST